MTTSVIELKERTVNNFSVSKLEKFINSDEFEDLVLWYQILEWETNNTKDFNSFKRELWL